ncbi:MAG: MaoC family dehydratase [Arenicellales bacterium]
MRFHEFSINQVIKAGPYLVTEAEILKFATAYDPQWFHTQPEQAKQGFFKGLIASGWHTCSIAMRLMADEALQDSGSFASPGLSYIKWRNPVRPNDELSVQATVLELKQSLKKGPPLGILVWRWQMFTQEQLEVLDLEVTSFFDLSFGNVN